MRRIATLALAALILLVMPLAVWAFNLNRVAMGALTYKTALDSQDFYARLLPALIDGTLQTSADPAIRVTADALSRDLSPANRMAVADKLLPARWLKSEVDGNIDRLIIWFGGQRPIPDINFDLTELRIGLTDTTNARAAAAIIIPGAPACRADQTLAILASLKNGAPGQWTTADFNYYPICYPENKELRQRSINIVAAALIKIGQTLPDRWALAQGLNQAKPDQIGPEALIRFRAQVWLLSRLIILLYLIPVGLFAVIMMLTIRSKKAFARWSGGLLILSGLLSLVPVVLSFRFADLYENIQKGIETGFGASGQLVNVLLGGLVRAVDSQITPGLLVETAIAVGIGIVAVFISVRLPRQWAVVAGQQAA